MSKLRLDELVVTSFETSVTPEAAAVAISTPQCPTPATMCFVCPPSKYTECELCDPTLLTVCFVCPPVTADCQDG